MNVIFGGNELHESLIPIGIRDSWNSSLRKVIAAGNYAFDFA